MSSEKTKRIGTDTLITSERNDGEGKVKRKLSEELTEFLLVKLQQVKAETLTAGPVAERIAAVSHLALCAGVSSDAR